MINLLNANFYRLKKNKAFLTIIILTILYATFILVNKYISLKKYHSYIEIEELTLNFINIIGYFIALITSLFLGDNSDNTTRLKIFAGHSRLSIYLSNLLTIILISFLLMFIYMFLILVIGLPLFNPVNINLKAFLPLILYTFINLITYASIFTFIGMVASDKVIVTIISLVTIFAFLIGGLLTKSRLEEIEYTTNTIMNTDGSYISKEEKNPLYLSPSKRKIFKFFLNINPFGIGLKIYDEEVSPKMLFYSLFNDIIFITSGIIIFNKKNLK